MNPLRTVAEWAIRGALSVAFLSAVADRFGLWGPPGTPGVAWGDWAHFLDYSNLLNSWMPEPLRTLAAWGATVAEFVLALALLIPWQTRWVAAASAALLAVFAISMTTTLGPKAPLDYSVWTAAAAAFLLSAISSPSPMQRN